MNIPLPLHATEGNGVQVWLSEADFDMYSINRGKKATALVATPLLESKKRKADEMTSTIPAAVDTAACCWEDVLHAKKTTLMPEDHKVYLELKQRKLAAQKSGLPEILALSESERETYTRIDTLVVAERRNFRKQFERLAKKELVVLTTLPAAIEKKVDEELRLRCEHVKNLYPQLYTPISQLDLSAKVLDIATPKHKLQGLVKKTPLTIREMPSVELAESTCRWPIGSVVSGDGTMRSLMAKHKCSIAMAASTLGALFDNHDGRFCKLWTIPVTVTTVNSRREVYLDKPLVNAKWSSREKLTLYCRHLLKHYLKVPDDKTQSYHVWDFSGIPVFLRVSSYTNAETKQPVTIHAKVDYEWSNLPEQITESERSAMWLHSWIRGNADIVYGLFHANGHRMLDLKQETIASIVSTDENSNSCSKSSSTSWTCRPVNIYSCTLTVRSKCTPAKRPCRPRKVWISTSGSTVLALGIAPTWPASCRSGVHRSFKFHTRFSSHRFASAISTRMAAAIALPSINAVATSIFASAKLDLSINRRQDRRSRRNNRDDDLALPTANPSRGPNAASKRTAPSSI
ncbi:hypothetical protein AC1031_006192 [Aphanomyces cochlioides]|nr:hypothetical protein AC1031_006192 [Aphanomyces cochlioides]